MPVLAHSKAMTESRIFVVSDIHFAAATEQSREGYEANSVDNLIGRFALKAFRDHIWLPQPTRQNHLLDSFLTAAENADLVVGNGDYSCNTGFIGVADDAAFESAEACLRILRSRFSSRFHATIGDHELGKKSLAGNRGGLRLESFNRIEQFELLRPFWTVRIGRYLLIGVTSTLVALPLFNPEILPAERTEWADLRVEHLREIQETFRQLTPQDRVILFCHDPSALPFLHSEPELIAKVKQIELTIIGHLHSPLVYFASRFFSGIPPIRFLGNSIRRFSSALQNAKGWRDFNVHLCPSLAGIELLKDGGFLELRVPNSGFGRVQCIRHRIFR